MPIKTPMPLNLPQAKRIWLHAQRLDEQAPFGTGAQATRAAVEHLGYVQIDTIHVIERCHHHILYARIPDYRREHLHQAQSIDKSVFEYWTHALSYVPTRDLPFFIRAMKQDWRKRTWLGTASPAELRNILTRIEQDGPLTLRDIEDEVLVEKSHAWASRKPSKRILQLAFYQGLLTVSAREGMLKTYELANRHFGWEKLPKAAPEHEITGYILDRALRAQGIVSLDSICHLDAGRKPSMRQMIEARLKRKQLVAVTLEGAEKQDYWARPDTLDAIPPATEPLVHILSPFDPLIIQRKRLKQIFGYDHRFEAYVPKEKRVLGYFALPVLIGDRVVAALDLKTDRANRKLLIQQWTWMERCESAALKQAIETELHHFERFQLAA
jgi:uncharacterized protein